MLSIWSASTWPQIQDSGWSWSKQCIKKWKSQKRSEYQPPNIEKSWKYPKLPVGAVDPFCSGCQENLVDHRWATVDQSWSTVDGRYAWFKIALEQIPDLLFFKRETDHGWSLDAVVLIGGGPLLTDFKILMKTLFRDARTITSRVPMTVIQPRFDKRVKVKN